MPSRPLVASSLYAAGLLALCACGQEEKKQAASSTEQRKEAALFSRPAEARSELESRFVARTSVTGSSLYLKRTGMLGENVLLTPIPNYKVECGPMGFSVIFQPDRNGQDNVDLKLTWTAFSDADCDLIVPAFGTFVRKRLGSR